MTFLRGLRLRGASLAGALALGVAGCGMGCAEAPPTKTTTTHLETPQPTAAAPASLPERPLSALLPAAGLKWLLVLRPRELAGSADLLAASTQLVPEKAWQRYQRVTGIQPLELEALAIARFDLATVYLLDADQVMLHAAERSFRERSSVSVDTRRPQAAIQILSGIIDGTPESLVELGPARFGLVVGSPLLAEAVAAFAWRSLRSKSALQSAALSVLASTLGNAPLQFYMPGPLTPETGEDPAGSASLATRATALAAAVRMESKDLHGTLALQGVFDIDDVAAATALWDRLAASPTGQLLNLGLALRGPRVDFQAGLLTLDASLDARVLAAGLRAAVGAEVDELLVPRGLAETQPNVVKSEASRSLDN